MLATLLSFTPIASADWIAEYGTPGNTAYSPGYYDSAAFAYQWSRGVGIDPHETRPEMSHVVLAGDHLFVTTDSFSNMIDSLHAFDVRTGAEVWTQQITADRLRGLTYGHGMVQVAVRSLGNTLQAFDAATGQHRYTLDPWVGSTPVVSGGELFIHGSRHGDSLRAYNSITGHRLWQVDREQATRVVAADSRYLYGSDFDDLWVADRQTGDVVWSIDIPDLFIPDPVVATGTGRAFVRSTSRLAAMDVDQQVVSWSRSGDFTANLAYAPGELFVAEGADFYVLDEATGDELWSWEGRRQRGRESKRY